jgi:putative DNA primase/helicase
MNYGHIVPKVAERLLQLGEEKIIEMLSEEVETIVEHARKTEIYNNLTERTAKQSALILVAVDILSEVMGLTFHKEEIRNFMEEHSLIKDTEQVSLGKRAMEWLLQYISKNRTQFLDERVRDGVGGCRGRIQKTKEVLLSTGEISDLRLYIADSEFVEILREGKFSEKATVLKEWKEMGYLKAQRDRYISNIKILQDISVKGYIVLLPVSMKDQWEEVEDITEIPFED